MNLMKLLESRDFSTIVYGSVARGDVSETSDVDVFIPYVVSSVMVELVLEEGSLKSSERLLVQATPSYAVKAYIYFDEKTSVSFPMTKMRSDEIDFYKLAGQLSHDDLLEDRRVPGITKELMLVSPVDDGHVEYLLTGRLEEAAKTLKVDASVLRRRMGVLLRRRKMGRTGVFKSIPLSRGETFEGVLRRLADKYPAIRRRMRSSD